MLPLVVAAACRPLPGNQGTLGKGSFQTTCGNQMPTLCTRIGLPSLAVGTEIDVYFAPYGGSQALTHPVSSRLFDEPGWTAFYAGDSVSLLDYTVIYSRAVGSVVPWACRPSTAGDDDWNCAPAGWPVEIGCDTPSQDVYLVPSTALGDPLMGVGEWHASVVPPIAKFGTIGNKVLWVSQLEAAEPAEAVLTLSLADLAQTWKIDLKVCRKTGWIPPVEPTPDTTTPDEAEAVEPVPDEPPVEGEPADEAEPVPDDEDVPADATEEGFDE
jgi:hypothetical protein